MTCQQFECSECRQRRSVRESIAVTAWDPRVGQVTWRVCGDCALKLCASGEARLAVPPGT
jgi:hypothetical protein